MAGQEGEHGMKRAGTTTREVPPDLPDHLRSPSIPVNPHSNIANRRFQAFEAYRLYSLALVEWLDRNAPGTSARVVQSELGTTFEEFRRVAEELPD